MKKVLIIAAILGAGYFAYSKNTTDTSDAAAATPAVKSRQDMINELLVIHKAEFTAKGFGAEIYNQFSDAEITQIYNVDSGAVPVDATYISMLKLHGWA
jgi:hypothetical protein